MTDHDRLFCKFVEVTERLDKLEQTWNRGFAELTARLDALVKQQTQETDDDSVDQIVRALELAKKIEELEASGASQWQLERLKPLLKALWRRRKLPKILCDQNGSLAIHWPTYDMLVWIHPSESIACLRHNLDYQQFAITEYAAVLKLVDRIVSE